MTDQIEPIQETSSQTEVKTTIPTIIYVLFLANFILPFTGLIAVIMAYVNKDGNAAFLETHYQFQIRTFWIGLLYGIIGIITTAIFIGWIILLFCAIWIIIRCVKGIKLLGAQQPVVNPKSWMFG